MGKLYWKPGNMLYPLPAVMVSVRDKDFDNIITVAWAGTINSDPAMLSISVRDFCGVASGRDVDKFKEMKLTKIDSKYVSAKSIAESPVNIECKVLYTKELGTHTIFMAEVLGVTVDDKYMDETGRFNLNDSNLITYSHGRYYTLGEPLGKFGHSVQKKK